jgi:hypothetical protein
MASRIRPVGGLARLRAARRLAARRIIVGLRALRTIGAPIMGVVSVLESERRRRCAGQKHQEKKLTHGHYLGTLIDTTIRAPLQMSGS